MLAMLILSILLTDIIFATSDRDDPKRKDALEDVESILSLGKTGDIGGLKKLSDELEKKWFQKDLEYYGTIICNIAEAFSRNDNIQNEKIKRALN